MGNSLEDLFRSLETALGEWNAAVKSAHDGLAQRLAGTQPLFTAPSPEGGEPKRRPARAPVAAASDEVLAKHTERIEHAAARVETAARTFAAEQAAVRTTVAELSVQWHQFQQHVTEDLAQIRDIVTQARAESGERQREIEEGARRSQRVEENIREVRDLLLEHARTRQAFLSEWRTVVEAQGDTIRGIEKGLADNYQTIQRLFSHEQEMLGLVRAHAEDIQRIRQQLAEAAARRQEEASAQQQALRELRIGMIEQLSRFRPEARPAHPGGPLSSESELPPSEPQLFTEAERESQAVAFPAEDVEPIVLRPTDDRGHRRRVGEILVDAGIITEDQLAAALEDQATGPRERLGAILVKKGLTGEDVIAQVIASQLQLPFVHLATLPVDENAVRLISGRLARLHQCIPVQATADNLTLAMSNPLDLIGIDDVSIATGRRVDPILATSSDIAKALDKHYGPE